MLSIIVAIALSQSLDLSDTPHNQRTRQFFRTGRTSSAVPMAFFEAFPSNGLGASQVTAYPLPNWAIQSENLLTSWVTQNSGAAAPTIVSATRATYPATTAAQYSFSSITNSSLTSGQVTVSAQVTGVSGAGTMDMVFYTGAAWVTSPCAFVAGSATTCSVSGTIVGTPQIGFGNASSLNGGTPRSISDVYVTRIMYNVGAARSPYIATTTAAKGYTVTGARSEALTFVRASNAYSSKKGLATTGIANGDLVLMPANQPRVEPDNDGVLGLRVESSRTNYNLRSEEFNNAAWGLQNATCGAVSVTANQAVAPDGTQSADKVDFAACSPATSPNRSTIFTNAAIACGLSTCVTSVYLKGVSGSGYVFMGVTPDGVTYLAQKKCTFVSDSWSRCVLEVSGIAASQYVVFGPDYRDAVQRADGAAPAASVYMWGAQYENGTYATSYIPTTSAAATRQTEGVPYFAISSTLPVGTNYSTAVSAMTNHVPTTGTTLASPHNGANPPLLGRFSGGNFGCYQRGPGDLAAGAWISGQNRWSCSTARSVTLNGTTSTSAGAVTIDALTNLGIGSTAFGAAVDGIYSRICLDPDPARCR